MSVGIAFPSKDILMLDCDDVDSNKLIRWCERRSRKYQLGSFLIMRTSVNKQLTIDQEKLPDSYSVVFGRRVSRKERKLHINDALKDGFVNLKFARMREHTGFISIRVNRKNQSKPHPIPFFYFKNGDRAGITEFLDFWSRYKNEN